MIQAVKALRFWYCTSIDRKLYITHGIFCAIYFLCCCTMVCGGCLAAVTIGRCHDGGVDYDGICRSNTVCKVENNL